MKWYKSRHFLAMRPAGTVIGYIIYGQIENKGGYDGRKKTKTYGCVTKW